MPSPGNRAQKITTRVATPDDAGIVEDILKRSYPPLMAKSYPAEMLAPAQELMCRANPNLLRSGRYYIATNTAGTALGCGGWSPNRPGSNEVEPGRAHIRHFAVAEDAIGQGVGKALYKRCALDASVLGFTTFEAFSSLNAEGFYLALGFRALEQAVISLGPGDELPSVRMEKTI